MYITREQYLQALKDTKNPMDDDSGFTGTLREEHTIGFWYQVDTKEFEYVFFTVRDDGKEFYTGYQ